MWRPRLPHPLRTSRSLQVVIGERLALFELHPFGPATPRTDHDSVLIDNLAVPAVPLAGFVLAALFSGIGIAAWALATRSQGKDLERCF